VLYLAEVQKQKTGFIGAVKAEIKLLAYQRADQSWIPVSGEEVIPTEEANNFNTGALVLADVNANRQLQRIQEAGRPLISILQNFSRQLEKSKNQEEEIEQWKESLKYQSEEMNQRQMEMEVRLEQLEQREEELKQLEAQQQVISTEREKVARLQQEIERNRRELEGAWDHLRGEQRRLGEKQSGFQQSGLDEATVRQIQELLDRLSSGITTTLSVGQELNLAFELVESLQATLNPHWQRLEEQRPTADQHQAEVDSQTIALQNSKQEWQQAQNSLEQNKAALQVQTNLLKSKQDYVQILNLQLHNQEDLYQQIYCLIQPACDILFSQKVDLEALEKMPLDQLQQMVQDLHRDWQNAYHFVNEQEEELRYKQQAINELQAQLSQANDHDQTNLEIELADEQDSYRFLHQTLVGQRQNLQERKDILRQHKIILWQRQGINPVDRQEEYKVDLEPILGQIQAQRQQQMQELQKLEQEIEQMRSSIDQVQRTIDHQVHEQEMKWQELQSLEQHLLSLRTVTADCWGQVNLYQEMLRPFQDSLDGLRNKLQTIAATLDQSQQPGDYQLEVISQIRQLFL